MTHVTASEQRLQGVLRRGSVYLLGPAAQLAAAFLAVSLITRIFSPADFGRYAAAMAVAQVLIPIFHLGLPSAITREYFDRGAEASLGRLVQLASLSAVLAVLCGVTGPLWVGVFANIPFGTLMLWAIAFAYGSCLLQGAQAVLRSADRAFAYVGLTTVLAVGGPALGLLLLLVWPSPQTYVLGLGVSALSAGLAGLAVTGARLQFARSPGLGAALRLGSPTVPHLLAMWVIIASDRVLIERILGLQALGEYQLAYQLGGVLIIALGAANNSWGPAIYGEHDDVVRWTLLADLRDSLAELTAIAVVALTWCSPFALAILAPADYTTGVSIIVVALTAASALPYVGYLVWMRVMFQQRRTRMLAWIAPVTAAVNVLVNLALLERFGVAIAGLSTLIAYLGLAGSTRLVGARMVELPRPSARTRTIVVIGFVATVVGVLAPSSGPWLLVRAVTAMAFGALWLKLLLPRIRSSSVGRVARTGGE